MTQFDPTSRLADDAEQQLPREETNGRADGKGPEAFDRLLGDLASLGDQAAIYLAARKDQVKLGARRALLGIALGLLALSIVAAVLVTAAALTVGGIARGLGELFGQRLWLGELVTGTVILAVTGIAGYFSVHNVLRNSRWNTINRYAELHKQQQSQQRPTPAESGAGRVGE